MSLLSRLERSLGRFAIPDLTLYLVCGQAGFLIKGLARPAFLEQIMFVPQKVHEGEWWRVLTFILYPPVRSFPLFSAFALYLFFIMGTALERNWGAFRYNVYLLIA